MASPRRRLPVALLACGSLIAAPVSPPRAQPAPTEAPVQTDQGAPAQAGPDQQAPPGQQANPDQAAGGDQGADLPSRVGRLARLSGTVSFHTADQDHWVPATLNYPVTGGDAFWTEPQASAAIEIAASRIDMASTTEWDIDQLDDHSLSATEAQGEVFLDLRDLLPNETWTIRTPRGAVTITAAGQYDVAAGDTQSPTLVTVIQGAAQVAGDNLALSVAPGQTATITGSGASGDAFRGSVGEGQHDAFLDAEMAAVTAPAATVAPPATAEAAPAPQAAADAAACPCAHASASATVTAVAPEAVRQMPGARQLASYGSWRDSSDYGRVWYPDVGSDWVPYREGRWDWIAPYGWTWIDDEPWGYAPFHYGRWVQIEDRWAWAPVYYAPGYVVPAYWRPVYAPALVGFFGFGAGLAAGLAIGGGFGFGLGFGGFGWGHIGWCPLGWGEPFRPWFGGARYFAGVNRYNVANIRNITYNNSVHNVTINNYRNAARGATVVPTSAMLRSERAADAHERFGRDQFGQAHAVGTPPRPTGATAGLTRRSAERLGVADAGAAGARASAPGPRLAGATGRASGAPALRPARTGLGQGGAPAAHGAAAPLRTAGGLAPVHGGGGATGTRVAAADRGTLRAGLPALRAPGAVTHAGSGAPGPAFTPHARTGGLAAAGGLGHPGLPNLRAPGQAVARGNPGAGAALRTQAAPGGTFGRAGAGGRPAGAPAFHATPAPAFHATPAPAFHTPANHAQQTPHYQAPAYHAPAYHAPAAAAPRYQAPAYHAPAYHAPSYATPRYQAPAYHAPAYHAPAYQAPAYHQPAFQPQYRAPAYQAPRYQPQAPRFQAPRAAPGGRRPWLP